MTAKDKVLRNEAKSLVVKLEDVDKRDKEIILSALQGMLLVAEVNKNKKAI